MVAPYADLQSENALILFIHHNRCTLELINHFKANDSHSIKTNHILLNHYRLTNVCM